MTEDTDTLPCAEKLSFDTKDLAESTAAAVDWQRGAKLKAYKCRHCEYWHLSSQPD